jgi:DHA2 family multidrug resistance protein
MQYLVEYGQRDDWFNSKLMIGLAVASVVGGAALVWRELTTNHPVIDFRVLRHRQMWVGTVLGIVMGVGLYASVFTLPVFLQSNLRMTAQQTGIVLLPGALATAVSMWVVGRLTNKFDARLLIATGAGTFAFSMWQLSQITSDSGRGDFIIPLILRGLGLGFMFVPLTTVTLAELSRPELPQGTALYNFFRQLGGSLGIAGVATIVSHDTVQAHAVLAEHVTKTDPASMARVAMLAHGFIGRGADPGTATTRAYAVLDRQMFGQASVIAYGHTYIIAALLVLALIPLLALVRQTKSANAAEMMLE